MADRSADPRPRRRYITAADSPVNQYAVRILGALVVSLGVVALSLHLPVAEVQHAVGWGPGAGEPHLEVQIAPEPLPPEDEAAAGGLGGAGAPITAFDARGRAADNGAGDTGRRPPASEAADEAERLSGPIPRLTARGLIIANPDQQPSVKGGPGALFARIHYPEAARRQGIEGRVVIHFVVDAEGAPHHVQVEQSLHPLCDSSAVRAIRLTHFVPGRQNGQPVPVRMRLPIQFKLIETGAPAPSTADATANE